eukprot:67175_1
MKLFYWTLLILACMSSSNNRKRKGEVITGSISNPSKKQKLTFHVREQDIYEENALQIYQTILLHPIIGISNVAQQIAEFSASMIKSCRVCQTEVIFDDMKESWNKYKYNTALVENKKRKQRSWKRDVFYYIFGTNLDQRKIEIECGDCGSLCELCEYNIATLMCECCESVACCVECSQDGVFQDDRHEDSYGEFFYPPKDIRMCNACIEDRGTYIYLTDSL